MSDSADGESVSEFTGKVGEEGYDGDDVDAKDTSRVRATSSSGEELVVFL